MMTMIVATRGLLPAAMSHDIVANVVCILGPPGDWLPPAEQSFMAEGEHVD